MTVFEEMYCILKPLGIYSLDDETVVKKELLTYAHGIDSCCNEIRTLSDEMFVQTARGCGLDLYEWLFGYGGAGVSENERRERLLYKFSRLPHDFTVSGMQRALNSIGFAGTVTELCGEETLMLGKINGSEAPKDYTKFIDGIYAILPAHLRISFDIAAPTWDEFDAWGKSFAQLDSAAVTWEFYRDR